MATFNDGSGKLEAAKHLEAEVNDIADKLIEVTGSAGKARIAFESRPEMNDGSYESNKLHLELIHREQKALEKTAKELEAEFHAMDQRIMKMRADSIIEKTGGIKNINNTVKEMFDDPYFKGGALLAEIIVQQQEYNAKQPKPAVPDRSTKPKFTERVEARRAELANQEISK